MYPLNTVSIVDNTWTITHMVKITWAPTLNRGFHSSNSRKNPCTVAMLCLASATCTYNLPQDSQNLKRPEFLFSKDPSSCSLLTYSIHCSAHIQMFPSMIVLTPRVVVSVQVKQVATVNLSTHQCTMKDEEW